MQTPVRSPIVIGIRGANGAGKTTVARRVMERAPKQEEVPAGVYIPTWLPVVNCGKFVTVGSYKRVCGGADTISDYKGIFTGIHALAVTGNNVLYEGVLVGTVFQPTVDLMMALQRDGVGIKLYCLNTSLEQCIENVNTRRAAEGKGPLERTVNVETNYKKHISSARKFHTLGWDVVWCSADEAVEGISHDLGL